MKCVFFYSGRVKCLGLIKDLVVSLEKILANNFIMDIFVADIPPRYGILLSQSWGEKLRGTLQLDFSYATILVFRKLRKLYWKNNMKYMINRKEKPNKNPIHVFHMDLESFILFNDDCSTYYLVLMEEKEKNSKFSNLVKKFQSAGKKEKMASSL